MLPAFRQAEVRVVLERVLPLNPLHHLLGLGFIEAFRARLPGILHDQAYEPVLLLAAGVARPAVGLDHRPHEVGVVAQELPLRHEHVHDVAA